MSEWLHLGPHRYRVEDDVFHWQPHGAVQPDEATRLVAMVRTVGRGVRPIYAHVDLRQAAPIPPASRKVYVDAAKTFRPRGVVVITGATLPVRVVLLMLLRAAQLLSNPRYSVHFFDDPHVALSFLLDCRAGQSHS
jgi:hypothetical protein